MTSRAPPDSHMTPFRRVFVANRGEIARRILRTCRAMGLETVAAYSEADAGSPHVREADVAICVGPPASAASYLRTDALVAAAQQAGADAVHPGYGFLSERADFAQAVTEAGLTWVGPSSRAIAAMGSKAEAKALLKQRAPEVPLIPGYAGLDQAPATLVAEADAIGYPVLLKASAGGGGKGMRIVHSRAEFAQALDSVQTESRNAFGDDRVLLEKYFSNVRHVEVQIMGDRYGSLVAIGERDCTIQRRHQKVLEECPCPVISEDVRSRLHAAACTVGRVIAYENAGTVEFILDPATNDFYFLEVNTRLQVEHTVTEQVFNLDLVQCQLRVAQGESLQALGLAGPKATVTGRGHSIQVRVYAEDAGNDFFPSVGPVLHFEVPPVTDVPWLRVDSAVESGSVITSFYDPMIAKVIVWGPTRAEALARLAHALVRIVIVGPVVTNVSFLLRLVQHEAVRSGALNTHFLQHHLADLITEAPSATATRHRTALLCVAAATDWHHRHTRRRTLRLVPSAFRNARGPSSSQAVRLVVPGPAGDPTPREQWSVAYECGDTVGGNLSGPWALRMTVHALPTDLSLGQPVLQDVVAGAEAAGSAHVVLHACEALNAVQGATVGDAHTRAHVVRVIADVNGLRQTFVVARLVDTSAATAVTRTRLLVHDSLTGNVLLMVKVPRLGVPTAAGDAAGAADDAAYTSRMPATVLSLGFASGDTVCEGNVLLTMESMKMEIKVTAAATGVVQYRVAAGDMIAEGTQLLTIQATDGEHSDDKQA